MFIHCVIADRGVDFDSGNYRYLNKTLLKSSASTEYLSVLAQNMLNYFLIARLIKY